jgi:aspartyl-tRNA(Asn)/glutamyl-tRNA(Gln) amidotransferase subunit A
MSDPDLLSLTVTEAARLLDERKTSSVELTQNYLNRIAEVDSQVKSYVNVTEEVALEQAKSADETIAKGLAVALTGVPFQLKDVICTKGITTTCSSRMLLNFVPPYDATVVTRLADCGSVLLGKGNMDEFAMGSSTENSAFFCTHNPWDLKRVPGGSSGGPAAAVAAGEAAYALGTDTGGSIRQPAAFCGIVGLKPTYGLVSRFGLVAFASSLDQIGPMTHDVTDCATVLNAIAGHDPRDSTSVQHQKLDYTRALNQDIKRLRVGVPREYFGEGIHKSITETLYKALGKLEELGASIDWDVSLPSTSYALAVYYIIAPSEASANLARYDGVKYGFSIDAPTMWEAMEQTREHGFGSEVKRRIMLGTYALSSGYYDAYYLKALKVRTLIRSEFDEAFKEHDILVTPTTPSVAFKIGEKSDDPLQMYLNDICTIPANIAGIPAISIPCGFVDGLPVGMQMMAKPFDEANLLRAAHAYEMATDWHHLRPAI